MKKPKALARVTNRPELATPFDATIENLPFAFAAALIVKVANVPSGLIIAELTVPIKGLEREKVALVKLAPVTVTFSVVPAWAARGFTDEMMGARITVSAKSDVAVVPATVMEIGPLIPALGIMTRSVVAVADSTVTATPPIVTLSKAGVVLKPCPWIVSVPPVAAIWGEASKMASAVAEDRTDRLI
jgi:hypothetical protein